MAGACPEARCAGWAAGSPGQLRPTQRGCTVRAAAETGTLLTPPSLRGVRGLQFGTVSAGALRDGRSTICPVVKPQKGPFLLSLWGVGEDISFSP